MRQESINDKKAKRQREAIHGVMFFALLQVVTAAAFASLCFIPEEPVLRNLAKTAAAEDLLALKEALENRVNEMLPVTCQLQGRRENAEVESGFLI